MRHVKLMALDFEYSIKLVETDKVAGIFGDRLAINREKAYDMKENYKNNNSRINVGGVCNMVEKKSPVAAVKAEEKKTSVESVKATVNTKKAEEVKEAPKAAPKAEEKETVKKAPAKKVIEKKPAAKKAAVKKTVEKKPETEKAAEAKEPVSSVILQYAGREVQADDWTRRAKEIWKEAGKPEAEIRDIKLYVKPEENMVYYVINEDMTGSFEL